MKRPFLAAAGALVAALTLAGCVESLCQKMDRTNRELADKAIRGKCNIQSHVFNTKSCEANTAECTPDDLQLLDNALECFEDLQCDPFDASKFEDAFRACRAPLRDLSAGCNATMPFL